VQTDRPVRTFEGHEKAVRSLGFAPDGATLASGSPDRTVRLWHVAAGELKQTLSGHSGEVYCVAVSRDGSTLPSASWAKTVKLWALSQ
jgi:WD40 repeat protein